MGELLSFAQGGYSHDSGPETPPAAQPPGGQRVVGSYVCAGLGATADMRTDSRVQYHREIGALMGIAGLPRLAAGDSRPLYLQIVQVLEHEVRSGRYRPGDQLPTQEGLAEHFGVSLAPVKQALRELEERGIIASRQGRGTYVLDATPLSQELIDANRIPNFTRDMLERGRQPRSRVLGVDVLPAAATGAVQQELKLGPTEKVLRVERVRLADGEPLCLQTGYFPERLVPGLDRRGIADEESLTQILQSEYGIAIAVSRQTISATAATEHDSQHLNVNPGAPLLLVERTSFLGTGEPVEFVVDRRVPEFNFVVWLRRQ